MFLAMRKFYSNSGTDIAEVEVTSPVARTAGQIYQETGIVPEWCNMADVAKQLKEHHTHQMTIRDTLKCWQCKSSKIDGWWKGTTIGWCESHLRCNVSGCAAIETVQPCAGPCGMCRGPTCPQHAGHHCKACDDLFCSAWCEDGVECACYSDTAARRAHAWTNQAYEKARIHAKQALQTNHTGAQGL